MTKNNTSSEHGAKKNLDAQTSDKQLASARKSRLSRKQKIIAGCVAAVLVIAGSIAAVPFLRYGLMGLVIAKNVELMVIDEASGKPVSGATVTLGRQDAKSDATGKVKLPGVAVGEYSLQIEKKNYESKTADFVVPIFAAIDTSTQRLKPTGRSVTLTIVDLVSKTPIDGATIDVDGATSVSDAKGIATVVLPVKASSQHGTIKAKGYNDAVLDLVVKNESQTQPVDMTPSGKLTYLSKETGKIDVMNTTLDGLERSTVLKGTGNEQESGTVLLSSRDWKYSALLTRRDGGQYDKLYLIDNQAGTSVLMDSVNGYYNLAGWSGHNFIYTVDRDQNVWVPGRSTLKFYDAEAKKLHVIDEAKSIHDPVSGSYAYESYTNTYIIENEVVYGKTWYYGNQYGGYNTSPVQKLSLTSVDPSSRTKKMVYSRDIPSNASFQTKLYEPQGVYLQIVSDYNYQAAEYFEYENGKVEKKTDITTTKFDQPYPTYLISPSGSKSFWYEERNGRNTLFTGTQFGLESKVAAERSEYKPYGWVGNRDQYVLVSKNDSELYIADPSKLGTDTYQPVKLTTYHKPQVQFAGYGYGYGGL